MVTKAEDFSFSPKSTQHHFNGTQTPDRLSISPQKLITHLSLKKDRHEALKNYYLTVIDQLKDFTRMSIHQLEDQRKDLIENIENKFKAAVRDIRIRAAKKETELREKLEEAVFHFDETSIIIKKLEVLGGDRDLVKEAEENLKSWAREVEVRSSNVVFPVPTLGCDVSEYNEYTVLSKGIRISGLISDISPLHEQGNGRLKLFVPFGYPEYTNYYVLQLGNSQICENVILALSQYFSIENLNLAYNDSLSRIPSSEKISASTKELYLVNT